MNQADGAVSCGASLRKSGFCHNPVIRTRKDNHNPDTPYLSGSERLGAASLFWFGKAIRNPQSVGLAVALNFCRCAPRLCFKAPCIPRFYHSQRPWAESLRVFRAGQRFEIATLGSVGRAPVCRRKARFAFKQLGVFHSEWTGIRTWIAYSK
jgi:hypothetical protein